MEKEIVPNRVYSSKEAAELLGINIMGLQRYCKNGTIKAKKIKEWKILGQSLIDFMVENDSR